MIVHIPNVLDKAQVSHIKGVMSGAIWVDGRVTAGHQSARAKTNLQLPEDGPEHCELGDMIRTAVQKNPLFISAVLPHSIFPPLFNRYDEGMTFGVHVDNSIRQSREGMRIRTDVSATLFLCDPEDYDGGELTVEDTYGSHSIKLPAGDLVVYPSDSLHYVTPILRGTRIASFFWIQSLIRDVRQRALLFDLDASIMRLTRDVPDHPALVSLTGTYHNLLRLWADV
jgi:PKHD-type hydroxylase